MSSRPAWVIDTIRQINRALSSNHRLISWQEYFGFRELYNRVDRHLQQDERTQLHYLFASAEDSLQQRFGPMPVFDDSIHVLPGYHSKRARDEQIELFRNQKFSRASQTKRVPSATGLDFYAQRRENALNNLYNERDRIRDRIRHVRTLPPEQQYWQIVELHTELDNIDNQIDDLELDFRYDDPGFFTPNRRPDDDEPPPPATVI